MGRYLWEGSPDPDACNKALSYGVTGIRFSRLYLRGFDVTPDCHSSVVEFKSASRYSEALHTIYAKEGKNGTSYRIPSGAL